MAATSWWVVAPSESGGVNGAGDKVQQAAAMPALAVAGPYPTQAAAAAALAEIKKAGTTTNPLEFAAQNVVPGLTGINAIGDFFSRLASANLWERVGEVVLGLILIAVGVAHITHAVPIATKVAKTAGAAAVLA
jgi:hypothetical protein